MLLDCNALAVGQAFFQLGGYEVSPDNTLLAYADDTVGRRQFRIRFKDIATGELLGDVIENVEADVAWADDNRTLLYVEKDPVTLLGRRVRAHVLGTPVATDRLVYEEPDESFDLIVDAQQVGASPVHRLRKHDQLRVALRARRRSVAEFRSGRAARARPRIPDRSISTSAF